MQLPFWRFVCLGCSNRAPLPWQMIPPGQPEDQSSWAPSRSSCPAPRRGLQATGQCRIPPANQGMPLSISSVMRSMRLLVLEQILIHGLSPASRETADATHTGHQDSFQQAAMLSSWEFAKGLNQPCSSSSTPEDAGSHFQALQPAHIRFRHGCMKDPTPQCVCLASASLEDNGDYKAAPLRSSARPSSGCDLSSCRKGHLGDSGALRQLLGCVASTPLPITPPHIVRSRLPRDLRFTITLRQLVLQPAWAAVGASW